MDNLSYKSKNSVHSKKSQNGSGCPKGQIMRTGYTTKTGKVVKKSCIPSQSSTGRKSSDELKKYILSREKIQQEARKRFSKDYKKCPSGYIMREGYKRESYKSHSKKGDSIKVKSSWTKPKCIKSQTGKSKKGDKKIVIMEKDVLGKYGYVHVKSLSPKERRNALRKAITNIKPLSVYRRLVALSTLNKGKDNALAKILKEDSEWIKTQVEYILNSSISKKSKKSKKSKTNESLKSSLSKKSLKSRTSKKSRTSLKGGSKTDRYDTGYIPRYKLDEMSSLKKKSKETSKKNKLFYYKDN